MKYSAWLALALALVACGAGCRNADEPAPAAPAVGPAAGPPSRLSLQESIGTDPVDAQLFEAQSRVKALPNKVEAWVQLGRLWTQKARETSDPGYHLNARDAADAALALDPKSALALGLLAQTELVNHRFKDAVGAADRALAVEPRDLTALSVKADALLELGRFDESTELVQTMVDLKPSLASYVRVGYLRWLRGDMPGALEAMRLAIGSGVSGKDPEPHAWALSQAAVLFWHSGDLTGAESGFDMALAARPEYPPALVGKGRIALARGQGEVAASFFERAYRKSPLVETAWLLGDALTVAGDAASAEGAYERVVTRGRVDDGRTLALFLATKKRDLDEAVRLAERELTQRGDVYTEDAVGFALFRAGRLAEARPHLDRAVQHGTLDASLLFHRGALLLAQGERAAGEASLKAALALNPEFNLDGAREARALLGK